MHKNRGDSPKRGLDAQGCLTLGNVLKAFSAAINEDQAWAICFQFAKAGQSAINKDCYLVSRTDHVRIHKDGFIHEVTFIPPKKSLARSPRGKCQCEFRLISKFSEVIFTALDHGLQDEEERHLSPDLVQLLEAMASAERPEPDDEFIEGDSGFSDYLSIGNVFNFESILKLCQSRFANSVLMTSGNKQMGYAAAESHYKEICRALVADTLELSTNKKVLQEASSSTKTGPNSGLDLNSNKLVFHDWESNYDKVIRELKVGVTLKKVNASYVHTAAQSAPAPPKSKMSDYETLLEYVKSKPVLKRASDRVLAPPPPKRLSPHEELMDSIRRGCKLRPTKIPTSLNTNGKFFDQVIEPLGSRPQKVVIPIPPMQRLEGLLTKICMCGKRFI